MTKFDDLRNVLIQSFPTLSAREILPHTSDLLKIARTLEGLDLAYCNRDLSPREWGLRGHLETELSRIAHDLDILIDHNPDPRGYTVYVHLPNGEYNSWGGTEHGYGI